MGRNDLEARWWRGTAMSIFAKKKLAGFALVAGAVAAPAAAQQQCLFETECFEADGCSEAAFELGLGAEMLETEFGDLEIVARPSEAPLQVLAVGPGAVYLLTAAPDGAARLSVQMTEGPMVITYLGRCEGAE